MKMNITHQINTRRQRQGQKFKRKYEPPLKQKEWTPPEPMVATVAPEWGIADDGRHVAHERSGCEICLLYFHQRDLKAMLKNIGKKRWATGHTVADLKRVMLAFWEKRGF